MSQERKEKPARWGTKRGNQKGITEMKTTTIEKYFSPAEVAEILGMNEQTIRKWLRQGVLRGVKCRASSRRRNAPWRVPESAIAEFMEGQAA